MAHQDQVVRLRKQEQNQKQAKLEKIRGEKPSKQVQCVRRNFFFIRFFYLMNDTENGKNKAIIVSLGRS